MLKLLHNPRKPALIIHLYLRKGMGVMDSVMRTKILISLGKLIFVYAVFSGVEQCAICHHSFVFDQAKDLTLLWQQ